MTVYESDLPGVGKKHEIELGEGARLVVVTHHTGKREVYRRPAPDRDAEKLFELSDELARQVGTVLEGAYFQPVRSQNVETMLGDDTLIEWVRLGDDSEFVGRTLGEADLRARTGVSVIAVDRDGETLANPDSTVELRAGDTVVAMGSREDCRRFRTLAGDGA